MMRTSTASRHYITGEWLRTHLRRAAEGHVPAPVLVHAGWRERSDYADAHIPGAIYLDTTRLETLPYWKLYEARALLRTLADHGITRASSVVVCGSQPLAAARTALALLYAGVEQVRVLDGGLGAWRRAGGPLVRGVSAPEPASHFGARAPLRPDLIASIEEVREIVDGACDDRSQLVSIRSWQEYVGTTSGYDTIEARGRIPGAVWGRAGSDADHLEDYLTPEDRLRSHARIEGYWLSAGLDPNRPIIFYCGGGWRASVALLVARELGWHRPRLFDGGWDAWSADSARPIASGPIEDGQSAAGALNRSTALPPAPPAAPPPRSLHASRRSSTSGAPVRGRAGRA